MNLVTKGINTENLPNAEGYFGEYGGAYLPEALEKVMKEAYRRCTDDGICPPKIPALLSAWD